MSNAGWFWLRQNSLPDYFCGAQLKIITSAQQKSTPGKVTFLPRVTLQYRKNVITIIIHHVTKFPKFYYNLLFKFLSLNQAHFFFQFKKIITPNKPKKCHEVMKTYRQLMKPELISQNVTSSRSQDTLN